jgi:hypothetical protein
MSLNSKAKKRTPAGRRRQQRLNEQNALTRELVRRQLERFARLARLAPKGEA